MRILTVWIPLLMLTSCFDTELEEQKKVNKGLLQRIETLEQKEATDDKDEVDCDEITKHHYNNYVNVFAGIGKTKEEIFALYNRQCIKIVENRNEVGEYINIYLGVENVLIYGFHNGTAIIAYHSQNSNKLAKQTRHLDGLAKTNYNYTITDETKVKGERSTIEWKIANRGMSKDCYVISELFGKNTDGTYKLCHKYYFKENVIFY
jgi:hypothetical protein